MLWDFLSFNDFYPVRDAAEYRIETVEQYLRAVDDAYKNLWGIKKCGCIRYSPKLWFRGLRTSDYSLIPAIGRENRSVELESHYLSKFKAKEKSEGLSTYWDWLFLMQHHGVPTRLMNWTEDPLVALIFAIDSEASTDEKEWDACVWCINPVKLNTAFIFHDYLPEGYVPNVQEKKVYELFGPGKNPFWNKKPAAVYGPVNNSGIVLQRGTFTVFPHTVSFVDMKELPDSSQYLLKIVIVRESRVFIADQLSRYGLTKAQLMPESTSEDPNASF